MARLRRADCSTAGFTRRRSGRGFVYLDQYGNKINDPEIVERIRAMVIPPAWADLWICPYPNGHIQAVGVDAAGRKQYLYHEAWRTRRDLEKFDHMISFARALPSLRSHASEHLQKRGVSRERVLAGAVRLLDRGFFRVGGDEYADQNQSYGLATIQRRHVQLEKPHLISFDYIAKSGKRRIQSVVDPDVYRLVATLKERRSGGSKLLAYRKGEDWVEIRSKDINEYIKTLTGDDFTAKDFRTWTATVLAAVALAVSGQVASSESGRKRAMSRAVHEVAHYLGNTPAVCRASYIDPRVFDRYVAGVTIGGALEGLGNVDILGEPSFQGEVERAVVDLLGNQTSDAMEQVA